MTPTLLTLLALAALGHAIFWVAIVNRLHAIALNRKVMDVLTGLCGLAVALLPPAVAWILLYGDVALQNAAWSYIAVCAVMCVLGLAHRLHVRLHSERSGAVVANHTSQSRVVDDRSLVLTAPGIPTWLSRVPGNQVLSITVAEKQLAIPRLAPRHDGLRIVHLSDLHMSGRITKPYFEAVVDEVNAARPDLVAVTGDIIERTSCIDWIPDTLGRLRAPGGVYYVLGNHDKKVDVDGLHQALKAAGLIHVGGKCHAVTINDTQLIVAGNELPWFEPAADLSNSPSRDVEGLPLRVVLAHSPDQFVWAQENEVDLVLAGHNHGGQVRVPLLGAILSPSLYGVRYAAGAFRSGDTVLHVSRGTSCLTPLRLNCPPEIAVLILRPIA